MFISILLTVGLVGLSSHRGVNILFTALLACLAGFLGRRNKCKLQHGTSLHWYLSETKELHQPTNGKLIKLGMYSFLSNGRKFTEDSGVRRGAQLHPNHAPLTRFHPPQKECQEVYTVLKFLLFLNRSRLNVYPNLFLLLTGISEQFLGWSRLNGESSQYRWCSLMKTKVPELHLEQVVVPGYPSSHGNIICCPARCTVHVYLIKPNPLLSSYFLLSLLKNGEKTKKTWLSTCNLERKTNFSYMTRRGLRSHRLYIRSNRMLAQNCQSISKMGRNSMTNPPTCNR